MGKYKRGEKGDGRKGMNGEENKWDSVEKNRGH